MCLILLAWQTHPEFPLVVAANRDEFYARPTAVAAPWPERPDILGGRDLEAGGTWLGVSRSGRFAAVTNVREPGKPAGRFSRGLLASRYLSGETDPRAYVAGVQLDAFSGFNLLVSDTQTLYYLSNRDASPRALPAGLYGVSNHLLETPWPKLVSAKARFRQALEALPDVSGLFALLADDEIVADEELPATGVSLEWERRLSAVFVRSPDYGTRASSVLIRHRNGGGVLVERSFVAEARKQSDVWLQFACAESDPGA